MEIDSNSTVNIPGLWIQGCSFENLEAGSQWTKKGLEILRMYGGKMEPRKLGSEEARKSGKRVYGKDCGK